MQRRAAPTMSRLILVPIFLLLLCFSASVFPQSGRRASPSRGQSADRNANQAASDENNKTDIKPFAGRQLNTPVKLLIARRLSSKHLLSEDVISSGFVKRLNEFSGITATPIGESKREEAVKKSKEQTDAFVVLLQFGIDSFQSGTVILNSQSLEIEYAIFAPLSGKQQAKGKVYYQPVGSGRMRKSGWPNGTPIKITPEGAAVDAAEQLYYSLALIVGVKPGP